CCASAAGTTVPCRRMAAWRAATCMACSAATPSVGPGWSSFQAGRLLPAITRPAWTGRWTSWRLPSSGILTSTASWQQRAEQHDGPQDEAGAPEKAECTADVAGIRNLPAVAHPVVFHPMLAVAARPGQLQAKRAGHGGFGPAGIGRAVASGIALDGRKRAKR